MANIVYLSFGNTRGVEVVNALEKINEGVAKLQELNGLRAEAINAGAATMKTVFGVNDAAGDPSDALAQALSDRWDSFLSAYNNSGNTEFAKLRDLVNAVINA